ncbi:MAG: ABC transporter permease [Cyclobacteriaceae bacterium]
MQLKLAWRNLWRNKRRTLITIASITFAVFLACIMLSMQLGTYQRMIDNTVRFQTGYIQLQNQNYWDEKTLNNSLAVSDSLLKAVEETELITSVVPRLQSFALASYQEKTKGTLVIGTDPAAENKITNLQSKLVEGTYFSSGKPGVLVSAGLAKFLQLAVNDTIVLISQGFRGANAAGKFPVSGIINIPSPDLNNQVIYMPLPEAQYFYAAENRVTALALMVPEPDDMKKAEDNLQEKLGEQYAVMNWREMMPELVQSIELDRVSGQIMMYILYAVIAFGIFGTFLMMTNERRYEFGILVSIGMRRVRLIFVMLSETILIGLLGVLAGSMLSAPFIFYLHNNPIYMGGEYAEIYAKFGLEPILPFSIEPEIFYRQAIVVLIISLLVGIYPIVKIWQLDAAVAIRDK